jgi:plasmid stability protein
MKTDCEIIVRKVPQELRKQLKIRAAVEDKTMHDLILEIISKYLEVRDD